MRPISPDRMKLLPGGAAAFRSLSSCASVIRIVTVCNVLLALYNFMCFTVPRVPSEPCVVILNNSGLQAAAEKGLLKISDLRTTFEAGLKKLPAAAAVAAAAAATVATYGLDPSEPAYRRDYRGAYVVLGDYVRAQREPPAFNESITYTTQASHEFLFPHTEELCTRWSGPVSIAVYAPGSDLAVVNRKLAHLVRCVPCVASNVTFHLVYHGNHTPPNIPADPQQYIASLDVNCTSPPTDASSYRRTANLIYPINVLRNAARLRARTKYVLASDIELYPSANIIPRFIKLINNEPAASGRHVYTLPIFEVDRSRPVPRTKRELQQLYSEKHAIFFHRYVCDQCQNFPLRERWLHWLPSDDRVKNASSPSSASVVASVSSLSSSSSSAPATSLSALAVFTTTKRRKDRSSWEPIYIGTNAEPLYAEELSWEGKRDKMSQMFELCLLDYEFRVLDDAFLCHAPGIKTLNRQELLWRSKFVRQTNAVYKTILKRIAAKHTSGVKPDKCL